jgi:type I restriction enzyme, R subunit
MWLTGFDAPSCSTVYLDKPMRNHTLMQTIARANRVFPGKHSGVIVDYANVFASLEKALAIYGAGKGGKSPVKDKQQLVEELRKAVMDATAFCATARRDLAEIEALPPAAWSAAAHRGRMNALISPDPLRRDFFGHERLVGTLYRAVKPDPAALEFAGRVACLTTLAAAIRAKLNPNPPDISQVMGRSSACSTSPSPATRSARRDRRRRSTCRRSTSRRWRSASRNRSTRTPTSKCSRPRSAPNWKS